MNTTPINEIISLIKDYDPDELIQLQKEFPHHHHLLKPGQTLGEGEEGDIFLVKMSVCVSGLKLTIKKSKGLLPKIKSKINRISNFQLANQIMIALSGATLISIIQEKYNWLKYISSALVLIGSVFGIYVQHISNSRYNNNSLFNVYSSLNENYLQAEQYLTDLEVYTQAKVLNDNNKIEVRQIIQHANAICFQIRKALSLY